MFSRLSLFTLVCLGFAVMLIGNAAEVHAQQSSLIVSGDTGADKVYAKGESVKTVFVAQIGTLPAPGEKLTITYNGVTGATISNGGDD